MKDREEVETRLAAIAPRLRAFGVSRVRLFGSFLRGEQTADSDIDLLIDFPADGLTLHNVFGAEAAIRDATGRTVDLLTPGGLSPHIGPHILREAEEVALAD